MEYELDNQLVMNNLRFDFKLNERFVYVTNEDGSYYEFQSPFLKVLKPIHIIYNKKKNIAKKYLILETNDELDFDNQIGDFMFVINKLHEISQEKIRENSIKWFNTEFDDIGLDLKVRRPIDHQKDNEFIKICIPINSIIEEKLNNVIKGDYVLCNILFKGLKVSSDFIMEEIEIKEIILQKEYDEIQNNKFINESVKENSIINQLLDEDVKELENLEHIEDLEELKENTKEKDLTGVFCNLHQPAENPLASHLKQSLLGPAEKDIENIEIVNENLTEITQSFINPDSKENNEVFRKLPQPQTSSPEIICNLPIYGLKKNKEKNENKKIVKDKRLTQIIKKSKKVIFT
jgi:hypothetical protein